MLMVLGMPLAFLGTESASQFHRIHLHGDQTPGRLGLPPKQPARGSANIRAVLVEAYAVNERLNVLLAQAGIRARSAADLTLVTRFDARYHRVDIRVGLFSWVAVNH